MDSKNKNLRYKGYEFLRNNWAYNEKKNVGFQYDTNNFGDQKVSWFSFKDDGVYFIIHTEVNQENSWRNNSELIKIANNLILNKDIKYS